MSIDDLFNMTGTLVLLRFHWFWMAAALGLGIWVGWRTAGEPEADDACAPPPEAGA